MRTNLSSAICWPSQYLLTATLMQGEGIPAGHVIGQYIGHVDTVGPGSSSFSQGVAGQGRG